MYLIFHSNSNDTFYFSLADTYFCFHRSAVKRDFTNFKLLEVSISHVCSSSNYRSHLFRFAGEMAKKKSLKHDKNSFIMLVIRWERIDRF